MLHLLFTKLLAAFGRWHDRRNTIRTLSGLNDHLLRDIGIDRHEIESAVRRSAGFRSAGSGSVVPGRPAGAVILPNGTLMNLSCGAAPGRG
jgi:uncharacterized protein YjiS (DUF1127 family)